jgi:hypothetical protein
MKFFLSTMERLRALYQTYGDKKEEIEERLETMNKEAFELYSESSEESLSRMRSLFMDFMFELDGGWFESALSDPRIRDDHRVETLVTRYKKLSSDDQKAFRDAVTMPSPGGAKLIASTQKEPMGVEGEERAGKDMFENLQGNLKWGVEQYGGREASTLVRSKSANDLLGRMLPDLASSQRNDERKKIMEKERKRFQQISQEEHGRVKKQLEDLESKMDSITRGVEIMQTAAAAAASKRMNDKDLLEAVEQLHMNARYMATQQANYIMATREQEQEIERLEKANDALRAMQSSLRRFILGYRPVSDQNANYWSQEFCLIPPNTKAYTQIVEPMYITERKFLDPAEAEELFRQTEGILDYEVVYQSLHRAAVAYALVGSGSEELQGSLDHFVGFMQNYGNLLQTNLLDRLLTFL